MKRAMILVILALFASTSYSQEITWLGKVGFNMSEHYGEHSTKASLHPGYRIGIGMDYAFSEMYSFQPTLFFSVKGAKYKLDDGEKQTFNQMYLEIPFDVLMHINVGYKTNFILMAGPYIAYGVSGKRKIEYGGQSVDVNLFGSKNDALNLNRLDAGLNVGVGMEFDRFVVHIDSDFGLLKLKDGAPNNLSFSATVGYCYNR